MKSTNRQKRANDSLRTLHQLSDAESQLVCFGCKDYFRLWRKPQKKKKNFQEKWLQQLPVFLLQRLQVPTQPFNWVHFLLGVIKWHGAERAKEALRNQTSLLRETLPTLKEHRRERTGGQTDEVTEAGYMLVKLPAKCFYPTIQSFSHPQLIFCT